MPLFEVTFSDGSTRTMQAHNKTMLREALKGVVLTRINQKRYCKKCHKVAATVQNLVCDPCWQEIRTTWIEMSAEWTDISISEEDLQNLALSFYVDG